jgi:hypothetical protein
MRRAVKGASKINGARQFIESLSIYKIAKLHSELLFSVR